MYSLFLLSLPARKPTPGLPKCHPLLHCEFLSHKKLLWIQWSPSKADTVGTTAVCPLIWRYLFFRGFWYTSSECDNVYSGWWTQRGRIFGPFRCCMRLRKVGTMSPPNVVHNFMEVVDECPDYWVNFVQFRYCWNYVRFTKYGSFHISGVLIIQNTRYTCTQTSILAGIVSIIFPQK